MAKPLHQDLFQHDGRGPELVRVYWARRGTLIEAIDYYNHADNYTQENLKHVRFIGPHVVMITPEEVIGTEQLTDIITTSRPAAMFDLGPTEWLRSFGQSHLTQCSHFQLLFYDELFDVICEV